MKRMTRSVAVGDVIIGGSGQVSIQSMTNTDTRDSQATLEQIRVLAAAGCQIIRVAVPDEEAVQALRSICGASPLPVVADIHFDYRLALAALDQGVSKVRINPGNIGARDKLEAVYKKAKSCGIPLRIGVNAGSLERDLLIRHGGPTAQALCESALRAAAFADSLGFEQLVVSLKSSDVPTNHQAHRLFAASSDLPLHIGLTEAGIGRRAEVKSIAAISALLLEGIGETLRLSLTGDPLREVELALEILEATGRRRVGIDLVSCPTCGRTRVDLNRIAAEVERALQPASALLADKGLFLRVAVMGCEVNGPGEAAGADIGVACGPGVGLLLEDGKPLKKVAEEEIVGELLALIDKKLLLLSGGCDKVTL